MTVQAVRTYESAKVAPVVMETDNGSSIIWLVDQDTHKSVAATSDESPPDAPQTDENAPGGTAPKPVPAAKDTAAPKGGSL
jgi:hypothetical protein